MHNFTLLAQLIVSLGLLNVWLLRRTKQTPYRGRDARSLAEEFAAYGLPNWFMLLIGTMKISAALLLIAGIWFPALVLPAASTVAVLMVGALLMHIRVRDPWSKSVPATLVLALCLVILLLPSLPSPPLQ